MVVMLKNFGLLLLTPLITLSLWGCLSTQFKEVKDSGELASAAEPRTSQEEQSPSSGKSLAATKKPSPIQALGKNAFKFHVNPSQVWESVLSVLMQNYNIAVADKSSGVITTEWDGFYLQDKTYRNKVSVFFRKGSWNSVEVVLYNSTEVLRDNERDSSTAIWLPAQADQKEAMRIVQNMAIYLNQPLPQLQDEVLATYPDSSIPKAH
jgi:hypothetical protein